MTRFDLVNLIRNKKKEKRKENKKLANSLSQMNDVKRKFSIYLA